MSHEGTVVVADDTQANLDMVCRMLTRYGYTVHAALTDDEHAAMRQHPVIGDRLCGDLRLLRQVRPIVRHHHEHLDGGGYPDGLRGDAIPLLAQIMGVVDVYDALTSERPYHAAMTLDVPAALAS